MKFSEFSLIDHISREFAPLTPAGVEGIGDDCAVLPYLDGQSLVLTTDMLVERVHFLAGKISPYDLGRKAVQVNLSDVAAMGARPLAITLSIALNSAAQDIDIEAFVSGVKSCGVPLIGGDTTASKSDFVISVTALGTAPAANIKRRSAARVGDRIFVTGPLGSSAAGLYCLLQGVENQELIEAHNCPTAHLRQGAELGAEPAVHAMMDVSDGVASDLRHILRASGNLTARIETDKIPLTKGLKSFCNLHSLCALDFALSGGEDYVLLLTAAPDFAPEKYDFPLYEIGEIITSKTDEPKIKWVPERSDTQGFTHF